MQKGFYQFTFSCSIVCLIIVGLHFETVFAQTPTLYAGASQVEITPPVGYPHYRGTSTAVHDQLYAKALVFHEGEEKAALVICDLLWITRDLSTKVRSLISEKTDIPFSNIIVAATHTHTSPAYHANILELNENVRSFSKAKQELGDNESYVSGLIQGIAQAVIEASAAAVEVRLEAGSGEAEGISFNRRFFMKDGRVRTNPGVGNPDIVRPAGPVDPEVGIVLLRRAADGEPLAGLTNFANHTDTVGGTEFSADYPGYLANALSEVLGDDFVSVFAMGTSGNINHVDVKKDNRPTAKDIGEKLAEVVLEEIPNLKTNERSSLTARSEVVYAPLQEYTPEELAWAQVEEEERTPLYEERAFLGRRRSLKIHHLERMRNSGEAIPPTVGTETWTLPVEVQVFRLGEDVAIVGLPGEVFVELGLAIKDASPFGTTLVVELTNSHIAYVPTEEAFTQGEYETVNSRLASGGGEMMVEAAIQVLNELNEELSH